VAVGDISCEPGGPVTEATCQQSATSELTESLDPAHVLGLGDLQYEEGSASSFSEAYDPVWGRLKARTKPVPGNHEYSTPGAEAYYEYFGQEEPYYAWNAGGWRIYMLNSNCSVVDCEAEEAWLEADLEANPRKCAAIAMHHPRFSSGLHRSYKPVTGLWRVAFDHRVDVALAAHDHNYERFAPLDETGKARPGRGIPSFVVGTGGRSLRGMGKEVPGSRYFQSSQFGVLLVTLARDEFAWEFHSIEGGILDAGSAPCL
jgi:hypothetical protein